MLTRPIMLRPLVIVLLAAGVLLLGCHLLGPAKAKQLPGQGPQTGPLSAGVAAVNVTPTGGASLAGFGGAPRRVLDATTIPLTLLALGGTCLDPNPSQAAALFAPEQGTIDPIMAHALVLSNGSRKIAIVKVDTIGMSRRLRNELATHAATLGIASRDLVVLATHTHSGPGGLSDQTLWEVAAADCFADSIYRQIRDGAVAALSQANAGLQPAMLGIGTTTVTNASKNRSGRPGIYDTQLGLLKVTTSGGAPLAALFNFAVHGTSFGITNMRFSADCMGAMEGVIQAGLPGVTAIFTNGAEGDVAPEHNGAAGVQQEGLIVGNAVLALWPTVATKSTIDLRAAFEDVQMPAPTYNTAFGCMPVPGTTKTLCNFVPGLPVGVPLVPSWLSTTLPFQAVRIDDTVFVGIPGEPITEIGWDLKQRATAKGFARGFVLGLANDHGAYFTTRAEYQRGSYEATSTLYGPATGESVVAAADAVMTAVQ